MFNWLRKVLKLEHSESSGDKIVPDPLTRNPTLVWNKLKSHQEIKKLKPLDPNTPITEDNVRFVCISDTHSKIEDLPLDFVPEGDILLHAGDITMIGEIHQLKKFNDYLGKLPHKYKVVIAGNHDLTFDNDLVYNRPDHLECMWGIKQADLFKHLKDSGVSSAKELFTNCTYLEDSVVQLYGINIYGSPWQPVFGGWGFNLARGEEILKKWKKIPDNTDILITHGPALGYGDDLRFGEHAGCVELLHTIQKRVHPKYHIFGHIHEGYGVTTDGHTTFINASTVTKRYLPINPPIIFDYPLPPGYTKQ